MTLMTECCWSTVVCILFIFIFVEHYYRKKNKKNPTNQACAGDIITSKSRAKLKNNSTTRVAMATIRGRMVT